MSYVTLQFHISYATMMLMVLSLAIKNKHNDMMHEIPEMAQLSHISKSNYNKKDNYFLILGVYIEL